MGLRFQQKLIIPSASRPLVVRAQLLTLLEQAITSKRVVALAAPAGWGKTTALAQWAGDSRLPVAWYTLDAADRDPQLFLDYLLHTVAAFAPGVEMIVAQLAAEPRGLPELIQATALALAAAPQPFALVFDDFFNRRHPGTTQAIMEFLLSTPAIAPFLVTGKKLWACDAARHPDYLRHMKSARVATRRSENTSSL